MCKRGIRWSRGVLHALVGVPLALGGCRAALGSEDLPSDMGVATGDVGTGRTGGADAGVTGCANPPASPPSCAGLAATCGANGDEDCCATLCVPGGTFALGRKAGDADDGACDTNGGPYVCGTGTNEAPAVTATVRAFWLDRFEVTVGRFREFVAAGSPEPAAGAGQHGYLTGGTESGWDAAWSVQSTASLACNATYQTWTTSAGANENKALNCLDWYSAYAFCVWDGGFLPTEAEWELAASGGEERVFPWSSPAGQTTIDHTYAVYYTTVAAFVGSKPAGDSKWGHADLAGNLVEWALDWYATRPLSPCNDCANLTSASLRVLRGGSFRDVVTNLRGARRYGRTPGASGDYLIGVRCARTQ